MSDDDGWIEWNGGECPVPSGTEVDLKFRPHNEQDLNTVHYHHGQPQFLWWTHHRDAGDIIAYRISNEGVN